MQLSGNKGEWSELYALFKLLGEGRLYAGDRELNQLADTGYPVIRIHRSERGRNFIYALNDGTVLISDGSEKQPLVISTAAFDKQAQLLLKKIKSEKGAFYYPELDNFLALIGCQSIKAKSSSKTDIRIVIYDTKVSRESDLGFSIKSQLGGDSTLLNASRTTNFIYRVNGIAFTDEEITAINAIKTKRKIKDRITEIQNKGGQFEYIGMESEIFEGNLKMLESFLPNILANFLLNFTCGMGSSVQSLTEIASLSNPLGFNMHYAHAFYAYKIKRFLTDIALGMMPATVWSGRYDATGGYLVIKGDGEMLCYPIYNKNEFEDYLYHNTKLETASSTRHNFGKLYREEGDYRFKLNLQIRFK
ncbi:HpaII family restriction endonuclease [Olivibacter sp. CPCC 100613]|uniref:HpaII family restriction endonuclease n=1 Tax=Olivibacter sp. CPCC 100613 TaxID=3079931 RepID=UPI002FF9B808